jgi:hypothetical protein
VSKSECAPQRVVVSLGEGATSATPSSATGRFLLGEASSHKKIEGEIWHRLAAGESCAVPRKTGVRVLSAVSADMRGEARNLMFRGDGRLTGPLVYRKVPYAGVRGAMISIALVAFLTLLLAVAVAVIAISDGLSTFSGERLRTMLCFGAILMAGLSGFMGGAVFLLGYRKTKVFNQPDFEAAGIGVEAISPEVKS